MWMALWPGAHLLLVVVGVHVRICDVDVGLAALEGMMMGLRQSEGSLECS